MISKIKPTTWEYVVHTENKDGSTLHLKSTGKFARPNKAKTYVSKDGKNWEFFGDFTVCEEGNTARRAMAELWDKKKKEK